MGKISEMVSQQSSILKSRTALSLGYSDADINRHKLLICLGGEVYNFIVENVPLNQSHVLILNSDQTLFNYSQKNLDVLIDLKPITFDKGQKCLYQVNHLLRDGGIFIACVNHVPSLKKGRFFSKKLFKSHAEVLGRLVNAGFSIIEFKIINDKLYVCSMKTAFPEPEPLRNDSIIIPMERIGKKGDKLKVFKFRTMYPFSEFLQDYVVGLNGYNDKGKPRDDFRLTTIGRFLRKYWIDELPQLYNLLRGELALVGVRPLSPSRYKELPEDVRQERIKYKPGCIPPYVALLMPDSIGNIEAERIYFKEKRKYYYWTDVKYFFKAFYNIISGKIRSA